MLPTHMCKQRTLSVYHMHFFIITVLHYIPFKHDYSCDCFIVLPLLSCSSNKRKRKLIDMKKMLDIFYEENARHILL